MEVVITRLKCFYALCLCFAGLLCVVCVTFHNGIPLNVQSENEVNVEKYQLGNSSNSLQWFVQVSDIHISIFQDSSRILQFEDFCNVAILQVIKPEVVLVTGDLTDAKDAAEEISEQQPEEWQRYADVLNRTGVRQKTIWLDIRGNHDAFNVPSLDSPQNYYRLLTPNNQHVQKSYHYVHVTKSGRKISFIAVDACPDPGPKRPFNFFGKLTDKELKRIASLKAESESSDETVWFAHYPLAFISSGAAELRSMFKPSSVYVCGHLHTLGGVGKHMYAKHAEGFMELELADWKHARGFRILAYDGSLFSFIDETFGTWPIILITNPVNAQLVRSDNDYDVMKRSTYIRILVFSSATVNQVEVHIDGVFQGFASKVDQQLYVLAWNPSLYSRGIHTIQVKASDTAGRQQEVTQSFSLDGSTVPFRFITQLFLKGDPTLGFKIVFAILAVASVVPLLIFRVCQRNLQLSVSGLWSDPVSSCTRLWLRRCYLLARNNTLFYWLLGYNVYVALGPWFVGYVIDGHIGACFAFGVFVNGAYIPDSLTFLYAIFQYSTVNLPLMVYLAVTLDRTLSSVKVTPSRPANGRCKAIVQWLKHHIPFVLLIIWQVYLAVFGFRRTYGLLVFLLGPVRTWSIGLAFFLRYVAMRRPHLIRSDAQHHDSD